MSVSKNNQTLSSHGGKRSGAGRKKGIPNKATAEFREVARQYAPEAMEELARLSKKAESEAARVAAIKEIFDRAYGKARDNEGEPQKHDHTICVTGVPRHGDPDT